MTPKVNAAVGPCQYRKDEPIYTHTEDEELIEVVQKLQVGFREILKGRPARDDSWLCVKNPPVCGRIGLMKKTGGPDWIALCPCFLRCCRQIQMELE